jgi:hypothetical protein
MPEWIIRDFTSGMHINPNRDAIADQDMWWMENLQPLASGNVVPCPPTGPNSLTIAPPLPSTGIYYQTEVQLQTIPYMFLCNTAGAAYIVNLRTGASTLIMAAATLNGAQTTYAVNYMGKGYQQGGFLIIDPNGYWDYGVTAVNTLTKIGATVGTSIATYAGRVWIGNNNTLSYTDINSYTSFGGAGGQATFSDQYLLNGITCLYAANNYLYILGATSVDVLSNVTVSVPGGVTSFSRVNVLQGLGVLFYNVMTVIGYARGLVFMDLTGLYLLAGATPERLSERIQSIFRNGIANLGNRNSCGLTNLNGELCLLFFTQGMTDVWSTNAGLGNKNMIFVYQRHRWWVHTFVSGNTNSAYAVSGIPQFANSYGAYISEAGSHVGLSQVFGGGTFPGWQLRTKLWDGGKAYSEKQGINIAFSAQWNYQAGPPTCPGPICPGGTGITFQVDSELFNTSPVLSIPTIPTIYVGLPNPGGSFVYATQVLKDVMAGNQGIGSQFIGLTFLGTTTQGGFFQPVASLEGIALRGKQENNKLE